MCDTLNEEGEEGLFSGLDSSQKKGSKLGGADTGWLDSWTLVVSKWSPSFWTWKWEISVWVSCREEIKHSYMQPSPLYPLSTIIVTHIQSFVSSQCNPQMPTGHFISAILNVHLRLLFCDVDPRVYNCQQLWKVNACYINIWQVLFKCQGKQVIPLYCWTMPMILNDWKSPSLIYTEVAYVLKSWV